MDSILLIAISLLLLIILVVLVMVYIFRPKSAKAPAKPVAATKPATSKVTPGFEELIAIVKDKGSSTQELKEATETILANYGTIPKKMGSRPHPDFDRYKSIIIALCRHPHVNKDIIVGFDRGLVSKNAGYTQEIDIVLKQGLSSRG